MRYSSLSLKDVVCLCAGPRDDEAWDEFVSRIGKPINLTIMRTASLWGEPSRSLMEAVGGGDAPASARIAVLRIDPRKWELEVMGTSRTCESGGHTAREWCERHKFTTAINAGMFKTDYKTHLGYLRYREYVNNEEVNA